MQATNKLKPINEVDAENRMVMRTPVLTGRLANVEGTYYDYLTADTASPNISDSTKF